MRSMMRSHRSLAIGEALVGEVQQERGRAGDGRRPNCNACEVKRSQRYQAERKAVIAQIAAIR